MRPARWGRHWCRLKRCPWQQQELARLPICSRRLQVGIGHQKVAWEDCRTDRPRWTLRREGALTCCVQQLLPEEGRAAVARARVVVRAETGLAEGLEAETEVAMAAQAKVAEGATAGAVVWVAVVKGVAEARAVGTAGWVTEVAGVAEWMEGATAGAAA